jgi:hypothetical protein
MFKHGSLLISKLTKINEGFEFTKYYDVKTVRLTVFANNFVNLLQ